jgi:hypothetical protein
MKTVALIFGFISEAWGSDGMVQMKVTIERLGGLTRIA